MYTRHCFMAALFTVSICCAGQADIFHQTSNQLIPGTLGIKPTKGVDLQGFDLESATLRLRNLTNAKLSNANLTEATFYQSILSGADLSGADVTRANLGSTRGFTSNQLYSTANYRSGDLRGIGLGKNNLAGWDLSRQNLSGGNVELSELVNTSFRNADLSNASLQFSELTGADLTGATVGYTDFRATTALGLTKEQIYVTASYQANDLRGIRLWENDLSTWNFSSQDLSHAKFHRSNLANADFDQAKVSGAYLVDVTSKGFTKEQLYSTASFQSQNLRGIDLSHNDLSGWDFHGQDLTESDLFRSNVNGADFSGSVILRSTLGSGMTRDQLYSTASYQAKKLNGVYFSSSDLSDWDLSDQNLTDAHLGYSRLKNATLSGATVTGANVEHTGITNEQIYSTRSYQSKDLRGVQFNGNDLTTVNLEEQNLAGASFVLTTLAGADLTFADISKADFALTTQNGFTKEQFYRTANYQAKNLREISLRGNDVSNWDFRQQDLTGVSFSQADLTDADFSKSLIEHTSFEDTTSQGFTKDQLYSTASYRDRNLQGIRLQSNDSRNWDLSEQNLVNADLFLSTLRNVNFSDSNLKGALLAPTFGTNLSGANLKNASLLGEEVGRALVDNLTVYNQWTVFPAGYDPIEAGLTFEESPIGDFDAGGFLDSEDVNSLIQKIRGVHQSKSYSADHMFDLNFDDRINRDDLEVWVHDIKNTWFGDSNLDGEFDSTDLVGVFQAGQYEDDLPFNSTWSTGDWNGDGDFNTGDMIIAFQDGGFTNGPRSSAIAIPEPGSAVLLGLALLLGLAARRRPFDPQSAV